MQGHFIARWLVFGQYYLEGRIIDIHLVFIQMNKIQLTAILFQKSKIMTERKKMFGMRNSSDHIFTENHSF